VLHGLLEVGYFALVDLCHRLVVLGCHREPSHVRVDVNGFNQTIGSLCKENRRQQRLMISVYYLLELRGKKTFIANLLRSILSFSLWRLKMGRKRSFLH